MASFARVVKLRCIATLRFPGFRSSSVSAVLSGLLRSVFLLAGVLENLKMMDTFDSVSGFVVGVLAYFIKAVFLIVVGSFCVVILVIRWAVAGCVWVLSCKKYNFNILSVYVLFVWACLCVGWHVLGRIMQGVNWVLALLTVAIDQVAYEVHRCSKDAEDTLTEYHVFPEVRNSKRSSSN